MRIYNFLQSKIGLSIVILLYFVLSLPLSLDWRLLSDTIGMDVGKLTVAAVVVIVMSRFYKWNRNEKILHTFIISFLFDFMRSLQPTLSFVIMVISVVMLYIIIQTIYKMLTKEK